MKKAVICLAHNLPNQLNLFIKQLVHDGSTDVYIHVNKDYKQIENDINVCEHVFLIKNSVSISWGNDKILEAIMLSFEEICKKNTYEYVLITTGQDLLIREGLDEYLSSCGDRVFIDMSLNDLKRANQTARARLLHKWPKMYLKRLDFKFNPIKILRKIRIGLAKKGLCLFRKKVYKRAKNSAFFYSTFWAAMPISVANYLLKEYQKEEVKKIYTDAMCPEEHFFATLIMNSSFKDKIIFVDGKSNSLTFAKAMINNHPPILTMEDIPMLESTECFFARKFNINQDKNVVYYFVNKITKEGD